MDKKTKDSWYKDEDIDINDADLYVLHTMYPRKEMERRTELVEALDKNTKEVTEKVTNEVIEKVTNEITKQRNIEIARKMLELKIKIEDISKATGLPENEIKEMK